MRFLAPTVIVLLAAVLTACGDPPASASPTAEDDVAVASTTARPTVNRDADPPGNPLGAARPDPPAARPAAARRPGRAPLRDEVALPDGRFDGVVTVMKLGALDQRVSAARVDVNRQRFVGRMTATEVHVQGDTIAMVAPSGSDVQLSLANLDGIILQQVLPKVDLREDWTSTPFSVIALSPDQTQLAIAPSKYAGLHPDSMFDDYVTGSTLGIRATEQRFIVYIYGVDGKRRQTHPGYLEPTWTPDGHVIMVGDGDVHPYGLYRLDPATERVERIDNGLVLAMANDPSVSPDGQRVAFAYQGQIWSMDIKGTALTPLARSPEHDLIFPVWSPDGSAIAYLKRRTSLGTVSAFYVIDLADDQNEYFHDLRRQSGTGEWELFEPWGCLSWTPE